MRVAVIVPVYNKGPYLARCLRSIFAQRLQDFELIIVDDGSTDDSMDVATSFQDPRITLLRQSNSGPGAARNAGIHAAQSEICAFLDADDEWQPDYLDESVACLESDTSLAAVVSGYIEYPRGVSTAQYWRKRGISEGVVELCSQYSPKHLVALLAYMSCWSTVARRDALLRWGGFYAAERCRYAEDAFLWLKILLNERVYFSTEPRVNFHREASELSNRGRGPRPIEPFLKHPNLIRRDCPPHLARLLEGFLTRRLVKTTCMLAYWGRWRSALALLSSWRNQTMQPLPQQGDVLPAAETVSTKDLAK